MRINKYISESGYCSRREADKLIEQSKVTINGTIAKLGDVVENGDTVKVSGKLISKVNKKVYIALNKPVGVTCTTDRRDKTNIIDFINHPERVFPIGRLDKDSEGLILLTNDGDIVNKILRAENYHEKEYVVTVDKPLTRDFIENMSRGVPILDTITRKCVVEPIAKNTFKIILTQGLNRQIRRMCEALGYNVRSLQRIRIMNIHLGRLKLGNWRNITPNELKQLFKLVQESSNNSEYISDIVEE